MQHVIFMVFKDMNGQNENQTKKQTNQEKFKKEHLGCSPILGQLYILYKMRTPYVISRSKCVGFQVNLT